MTQTKDGPDHLAEFADELLLLAYVGDGYSAWDARNRRVLRTAYRKVREALGRRDGKDGSK